MFIINYIYHNFYSVCALIPAVFMFAIFLTFVFIRGKSSATRHLVLIFGFMTIFFSAYIFSAMIYHPFAAYHRWITVLFVFPVGIHITLFFFHYPELIYPKLARAMGITLYIISIIVAVIFFLQTYSAPKIFHFSGHYWDFDADNVSKFVSIIILIFIGNFFILGICRFFITKRKERWTILSMNIVFTICIVAPAIANTLSRDGMLDRGTYQVFEDLSVIVGFFIVAIIYINNTKDRSNFMTKIIGISLATLLLIFQGLSYFALQDIEDAYDSMRIKDMKLALKAGQKMHGLQYIVSYSIKDDKFNKIYTMPGTDIDYMYYRTEFLNTLLLKKIKNLKSDNFIEEVNKLLETSHPFFVGYKNTILGYTKLLTSQKKDAKQRTLNYSEGLERIILYTFNKIKSIPENDFRREIKKYFKRSDPRIVSFKEAILTYAKNNNSLSDKTLKFNSLQFLAPMRPGGERAYRASRNGNHYTSYTRVSGDDLVFETGFSYIMYRERIHPIALKFIFLLGSMLLVVLIGYQFFFYGAFVRPIKILLKAIYLVREGDLEVKIPVKVEDELGYISKNFNMMIKSLAIARRKLDDYATDLEKKVEERTVELEETNRELKTNLEIIEEMNDNLITTTKDLEYAQMVMERDMEMAIHVQRNFFPIEAPKSRDWEVHYIFKPMSGVSGDIYDFYFEDDILKGVSLFDVSGHGIASGLITMITKITISNKFYSMLDVKLGHVLESANERIIQEMENVDNYITGILLRFNENRVEYVNAGHPDMLYYSSSTGNVIMVKPRDYQMTGPILGVKGFKSTYEIINFSMNRGDYLLLYSDCLIESKNNSKEEFGMKRLMKTFKNTVENNSEFLIENIVEELYKFIGTKTLNDDLTVILIKRKT